MALEEFIGFLTAFFILAIPTFIALALLDRIRDMLRSKDMIKDLFVLFIVSYLLVIAIFPFVVPEDILPFESAYITYALALALIFAVYLVVYNKTK